MATDVLSSSADSFPTSVDAPAAGNPRTSASVRGPLAQITNLGRWLRERLAAMQGSFLPLGGLFPVAATVDATADAFTITGHGLANNDPVEVWAIGAGASLPGGLSAQTTYFVVNKTTDTFQVAATSGGSAIDLTSTGSDVFVSKRAAIYGYVPAYSGSSFTIAAGSVWTFLKLLADKAGKLDASNTWTGNVNTFNALALAKALLTNPGTITDAATATIDVTSFVWIADSASQQIDVTVSNTGAADGLLLIVGRSPTGANTVVLKRSGSAAAIVTLGSGAACGAILIRRAGVWRLLFGGQNTTAGADA